jgi:hypothetical protein
MSVASPPAPAQDEPEALIEEAWELTRRRRRRRIAAAAGVLLVAVGIAAIVGVSQSGGQIRRSGGRGSAGVAADGQFMGRVWYTRAIGQRLTPLPIVPRVMGAGAKAGPVPLVYFHMRTSYETWIGSDGSFRQRQVVLSESFATAAGRRRWDAAHQSLPSGAAVGTGSDGLSVGNGEFPAGLGDTQSDPGDSLFTAGQLLGLPDNPRAVSHMLVAAQRALIRRQEEAYVQSGPHHAAEVARLVRLNESRQQLAFAVLDSVSSLAISPISGQLRRRLVSAAGMIPGVRTSTSGNRLSLTVPGLKFVGPVVFDGRSGQLLQGMPQAPGMIVAQGIVSQIGALPHGVRLIIARHLPTPPAPNLTPAKGTAHTTFTLKLPAAAVGATSAPRVFADMTGPTGPDCHYQYSQPGVAQIPTGTSSGGMDSFSVAPRVIGRASWCSGRYGLQVAVGKDATLGTGQGSTVYFTVQ